MEDLFESVLKDFFFESIFDDFAAGASGEGVVYFLKLDKLGEFAFIFFFDDGIDVFCFFVICLKILFPFFVLLEYLFEFGVDFGFVHFRAEVLYFFFCLKDLELVVAGEVLLLALFKFFRKVF